MRWKLPNLGVFEGTPEEIAEAIKRLREQGILSAPAPPTPPPDDDAGDPVGPHELAQLVDARHTKPTPPVRVHSPTPVVQPSEHLRAPPTNEQLLYEYRHERGMTTDTRRARLSAATDFAYTIAPKSLLDATDDDVRAWERRLIDLACKHLQFRGTRGQSEALPQLLCRAGQFTWTPARPPNCNASCPLFQRQQTGPAARLGHLRAFYEFVRSRRLRADNPVDFVAKRKRGRRVGLGKRKYSPTTREIQDLLWALRQVGTLVDVAVLLALSKWGRRPSHTIAVRGDELVGVLHLDPEGHAFADFTGVLERVLNESDDGDSKLANGYLISPIDHEFLSFLRHEYLPWRQRKWGYAWNEGPLFPGERGGPLNEQLIQERLDHAMRYLVKLAPDAATRARWESHLRTRSKTRISPGVFRHWFTTTLESFGVAREDRKVLRGDAIADALEDYRHLTPKQICERYPTAIVLLDRGAADG